MAHPYRRSTIGFMSEISSVNRTDAEALYKKYYIPANITVTLVGDVKAATRHAHPGKVLWTPAQRHASSGVRTVEPPQLGEKTVDPQRTGAALVC